MKEKILKIGAVATVLLLLVGGIVTASGGSILGSVFTSQNSDNSLPTQPAGPDVVKSIEGPNIPTLTESEKIKSKEIVLNDPFIQGILKGKDYKFGNIGVSHTGDLKKTGSIVEINLDKNYWIETEQTKKWGQTLVVSVDLGKEQVNGLIPMEGRGPKVPVAVLPHELAKAKEIAFNDRTVEKMLEGKNYTTEIIGVWYKPEKPEGLVAFKTVFDKPYKDEYIWMSKGKSQQAIIQATGMAIAVDLGTEKVVTILPTKDKLKEG